MKYGGVRPLPAAEQMSACLDLLDVRDGEHPATPHARNNELVGRDAAVDEEVRAGIDRGGVDSEVPEHRRRSDIELRFVAVVRSSPGVSNSFASSIVGKNRVLPTTAGSTPDSTAFRSGISVARSSWAAMSRAPAGQTVELSGCRDQGELPIFRWTEVHPNLPVGKAGRLVCHLRRLGRGGDDDGRRDAEGERDGGERRSGAGLVPDEIS